jgi:prepilin peptidase CpaA
MFLATCEILLFGLLIAGAVCDVWLFRLPNWLTIATALAGSAAAVASVTSLTEVLLHLAAGAVLLGMGILAFRFRMLGGGDAKWLAGLALWIGLDLELMRFLMLTTLLGGLLAIAILVLARFRPTYGLQDGKRHLPYGVAIAAAGLDFWFQHSYLATNLRAIWGI